MKGKFAVTCQECSLSERCISKPLLDSEMDIVDAEIKRAEPLHKNNHIFNSGDKFISLYAVRSGALETSSICEIPYHQVEILSSKISKLQSHIYRVLTRLQNQKSCLHTAKSLKYLSIKDFFLQILPINRSETFTKQLSAQLKLNISHAKTM